MRPRTAEDAVPAGRDCYMTDMNSAKRILITDDDEAIADLIADSLEEEGFVCVLAADGEQALDLVLKQREPFDLIILDIMMPHADGLTVCRRIRDEVSCPILFVTAKNRSLDTVVGLEMGADDYIYKPFGVDELVARVKAHLRRSERESHKQDHAPLKSGGIWLDRDRYLVRKDGQNVNLTTREFQLLQFLVENEGKVLSRETIFDQVWGENYMDIGTVAVNIRNLRSKLDPENQYIRTVWGIGYKFVSTPAQED